MIKRNLGDILSKVSRKYPVVTVTGPRQSGKTTLVRSVFPNKPYLSMEALDLRSYAEQDPRGLLAEYAGGAVLDEVQHVPTLLSYLQVEVDERPRPGRFILTGSQHFGLSQHISQSLAGRTAVLVLQTLSLDEVRRFPAAPGDLFHTLWTGSYPRIHDRKIQAGRWLSDYVTTYIQRDVRQVLNVADLAAFTTFLRLCAGRTAQVLNLSALGEDCGITHNTARAWLSVLEAGYICFRLPAWHLNLKKQLVKSPKLHFFDSGLLCFLLGIQDAGQLMHHPLRGPIFESWVASEVYKALAGRGLEPRLFHFRESRGLEVDLVVEGGRSMTLVETKSGSTIQPDFFRPLRRLSEIIAGRTAGRTIKRLILYGGESAQRRSDAQVIPWSAITSNPWNT